jgi:hypothetical protein
MAKYYAIRKGNNIWLPLYCNAEMLTLEHFRDTPVVITPYGAVNFTNHRDEPTHFRIEIEFTDGHITDKSLDKLINYINANI